MLPQNFDNVDEQFRKLKAVCDEATKKYEILAYEIDAHEKDDLQINPDLMNQFKRSIIDQKKAVDDYNTFLVSCVHNNVDLTNHWRELGFSEAEIKKMSQQ